MGEISKIDQARRISKQYSASCEEVYDLLKQGKSADAIIKKVKRRRKKLDADRDRISYLLKFYGGGDICFDDETRENVIKSILDAASAGQMDTVAEFIMERLKESKRRALRWNILIKAVLCLIEIVTVYFVVSGYVRGDRFAVAANVIWGIMILAYIVSSFTRQCSMRLFEEATKREYNRAINERAPWRSCWVVLRDSKVVLWRSGLIFYDRTW